MGSGPSAQSGKESKVHSSKKQSLVKTLNCTKVEREEMDPNPEKKAEDKKPTGENIEPCCPEMPTSGQEAVELSSTKHNLNDENELAAGDRHDFCPTKEQTTEANAADERREQFNTESNSETDLIPDSDISKDHSDIGNGIQQDNDSNSYVRDNHSEENELNSRQMNNDNTSVERDSDQTKEATEGKNTSLYEDNNETDKIQREDTDLNKSVDNEKDNTDMPTGDRTETSPHEKETIEKGDEENKVESNLNNTTGRKTDNTDIENGADLSEDATSTKSQEDPGKAKETKDVPEKDEDDSYERKNLLFYQNKMPSRPFPGAKIDDMLAWKGDYEQLERGHSYIQWLFPIPDSQGLNYSAQQLYEHEAKAIRDDEILHGRVLLAYKMMLNFYGMEVVCDNTGEIQRCEENWKERFEHLNRSRHNYMRLTRIITSIGELGYERFQVPLVRLIMHEAIITEELPDMNSPNCIGYWIDAIKDEGERFEMYKLMFEMTNDPGKFKTAENQEETLENREDIPENKEDMYKNKVDMPENREETPENSEEIPKNKEDMYENKAEMRENKETSPGNREQIPKNNEKMRENKEEMREQKEKMREQKEEMRENKENIPENKSEIPEKKEEMREKKDGINDKPENGDVHSTSETTIVTKESKKEENSSTEIENERNKEENNFVNDKKGMIEKTNNEATTSDENVANKYVIPGNTTEKMNSNETRVEDENISKSEERDLKSQKREEDDVDTADNENNTNVTNNVEVKVNAYSENGTENIAKGNNNESSEAHAENDNDTSTITENREVLDDATQTTGNNNSRAERAMDF